MRNVIEVLQADLKRMAEHVKESDMALEDERGKGNSSLIEINAIRRGKQSETERIRL
jgi:hypothetical protein